MQELLQFKKSLQVKKIFFIEDEPLKKHVSFYVGGPAAVFCEPKDSEELAVVLKLAKKQGIKFFLLGNGTNVLFPDYGYNGVIIHIGNAFSEITCENGKIYAGAGALLKEVCVFAQENALSGMEFAYGIPGSVGGAVYMNAGAYIGEMRNILNSVVLLDDEYNVREIPLDEAELGYRMSIFQTKPWYILSASFLLEQGDKSEILAKMQDFMKRRESKQPLDLPSAGSAFKRPQGSYASALIDQCGLRGYRVNDAAISEKHCGFIVNLGNATAIDILKLAENVSAIVKEKTGYVLEKEIRIIE